MIRRSVDNEFWLIAQHDHALLAGELARRVGNDRYRALPARAAVGVDLHDCGWPLHDELGGGADRSETDPVLTGPRLNTRGWPIDVFESTPEIALAVWTASADRAAAVDPYAGLLVSLHVLALSVFAAGQQPASGAAGFDARAAKARFELNRFQHRQIELQEHLRRRLGLAVNLPLRHGLAEGSDRPDERELTYHFRMLQAMDLVSLGLCCTDVPSAMVRNVPTAPESRTAGDANLLGLTRIDRTTLSVNPWPFDTSRIELSVNCRRLPAGRFASVEALHEALSGAAAGRLQFTVVPG